MRTEPPVFDWNTMVSMTDAETRCVGIALSSVFDAVMAVRDEIRGLRADLAGVAAPESPEGGET